LSGFGFVIRVYIIEAYKVKSLTNFWHRLLMIIRPNLNAKTFADTFIDMSSNELTE